MEQNILLTTDAVVFAKQGDEVFVLLIQRKNDPYKGAWALPGGFVDDEEDLTDAAKRELREETGLEINILRQLKAYGTPGRDPRGRTVTIAFYTPQPLSAQSTVAGADDAKDARWFDVKDLPVLAFDHAQIIEDAIAALN